MASLGAVIAHEIGHAIQPGYSFPIRLGPDDQHLITRFQQCLQLTFIASGMTAQRSVITLDENWADAIAFRTIERYLRGLGTVTAQDGTVLLFQTYCAAGHPPFTPLSQDPHGSSHARIDATGKSSVGFYSIFDCVPDKQRICGI
jgi:hypothetical protein